MRTPILEKSNALVKALCLVSLMLLCSVLSLLLYAQFFGGNSLSALRALQAMQSIFIFILPCLIASMLWSARPLHWLRLRQAPSLPSIGIVIILVICATPFINLLSHCNQQLTLPESLSYVEEWMRNSEENASSLTKQFLSGTHWSDLVINLLIMSLLPALSEEILFRGTLQPLFSEHRNRHCAIWCCAILFSAIHMQFYGFIPRMLMGAVLGYMLVWSGSLWLSIIGHATNNALAVVTYFVCERSGYSSDLADNFGTGDSLWVGVLSGVVTLCLLYALRRSLTMSSASSLRASGN